VWTKIVIAPNQPPSDRFKPASILPCQESIPVSIHGTVLPRGGGSKIVTFMSNVVPTRHKGMESDRPGGKAFTSAIHIVPNWTNRQQHSR
jgi:hypothetical protein